MIHLKFIIMLILSVWLIHKSMPEEIKTKRYFIQHIPFVYRLQILKMCIKKFFVRIQLNARRSDNARKFYTMIFIVILLVISYVDFLATKEAFQIINSAKEITTDFISEKDGGCLVDNDCVRYIYQPFMSNAIIMLGLQIFTLLLFYYKISDRLLLFIKDNWEITGLANCLLLAVIAMFSMAYVILAEHIVILMIAARYYPYKKTTVIPDGGIGMKIPDQGQQINAQAA